MFHKRIFGAISTCFLAILLVVAGCGRSDLPELGTVSGTVTLDGRPVTGLGVAFYPLSGGRQALGVTDENGKYNLTFVDGVPGAKTGTNEVTLFWPDPDTPPSVRLPAKYNTQKPRFEVEPGENVFDIALDSK